MHYYQGNAGPQGTTPSRVDFRKTGKKVVQKKTFEQVAIDKSVVNKLKPHQKKSFFRHYHKATNRRDQFAALEEAKRVLNRNTQKEKEQLTLTSPQTNQSANKTWTASTSRPPNNSEEANVGMDEIAHSNTASSDNTEGPNAEDTEKVTAYLNTLAPHALEHYLQKRFADKFVSKETFDTVNEELSYFKEAEELIK